MGEAERGEAAPRTFVSYWCANGHEVTPSFAVEDGVEIPEQWECKRCGLPAGKDKDNPPAPPTAEVYKTHLAYVKERRSDSEGEAILEERLGGYGVAAMCAGGGQAGAVVIDVPAPANR